MSEKSNREGGESVGTEAAVPCLVPVWGQQCPAGSGVMGKATSSGEEGLIWGFKAFFQLLLASAATAPLNRVVFHWTSPDFLELNKNPILTLEAFPAIAFAQGTQGCGRCFPAFPWCNEMPRPFSVSLASRFPALRSPQENQSRGWDLLGVSLGVRWGSPSPMGNPHQQLWLRIP